MLGCAALGVLLSLGGPAALADGVVQADSRSFILDTTGAESAGGVSQAHSSRFTLDTTGTPVGIGGTAQSDSLDFVLDTTGTAAGEGGTAQGSSRDFTLNTTGESPGVFASSATFTLDTRDAAPPTPATLSGAACLSGERFLFSVGGTEGVHYVIQANTNLSATNWLALFTNTAPFIFADLSASNHARRFYRAVYSP